MSVWDSFISWGHQPCAYPFDFPSCLAGWPLIYCSLLSLHNRRHADPGSAFPSHWPMHVAHVHICSLWIFMFQTVSCLSLMPLRAIAALRWSTAVGLYLCLILNQTHGLSRTNNNFWHFLSVSESSTLDLEACTVLEYSWVKAWVYKDIEIQKSLFWACLWLE